MRFTRRGECALLGLIYLIKQGEGLGGSPVRYTQGMAEEKPIAYVAEVAKALNLPQKLLAQVFYRLARSGLLRSHRGRGGGFSMAMPAGEITLKDVIVAVQGEPVTYRCVAQNRVCSTFAKCSLQDVLYQLHEQTMETLGSITVDKLAEGMVFG